MDLTLLSLRIKVFKFEFEFCHYTKVTILSHWRKNGTCGHRLLFKFACLYSAAIQK